MQLDETEHLLAVLVGHLVVGLDDAAVVEERLELGDGIPRSPHGPSVRAVDALDIPRCAAASSSCSARRSPGWRWSITWIFTNRVDIAFKGDFWLPFLGLLFLPYTTFFYVLAYAPVREVTGIGWFFVAFGFLLDLAS